MSTGYTTAQEASLALVSAYKIDHPQRMTTAAMQESLDAGGIDFAALLELAWGAAGEVRRAHQALDKIAAREPCACRLCELVAFVYRERKALQAERAGRGEEQQ